MPLVASSPSGSAHGSTAASSAHNSATSAPPASTRPKRASVAPRGSARARGGTSSAGGLAVGLPVGGVGALLGSPAATTGLDRKHGGQKLSGVRAGHLGH